MQIIVLLLLFVEASPAPFLHNTSNAHFASSTFRVFSMATASVSLQDVLYAIGGPLEEKSLWALLSQSTKSLAKALQGIYIAREKANNARARDYFYSCMPAGHPSIPLTVRVGEA